jgi:hypothetical protein
MAAYLAESVTNSPPEPQPRAVPAVPLPDKKDENKMRTSEITHPPTPEALSLKTEISAADSGTLPPRETMSRDEIRFLTDVAARSLEKDPSVELMTWLDL